LGDTGALGYPDPVARHCRVSLRAHRATIRARLPARHRGGSRPVRRYPVAANCDVCGKGPGFGHNISHSHRRTKRRWNPNIQRVRAMVGATPKRLNVCTSCLKAGKVTR
jgi:large subunit ribosomal protein L28